MPKMTCTRLALCLTVVAFVCPSILSTSVPVLSTTGNATILVFIDLHLGVHDNGTCYQPVWENFELVYSVVWKNHFDNDSEAAVEVYDTCGSSRRVLDVLHSRLYTAQCQGQAPSPVIGVISYTSQQIADVISGITELSDMLHVEIRGDMNIDAQSMDKKNRIYADLASKNNVELLLTVLHELDWTYITTISDNDPVSLRELSLFLNAINGSDICVQYSMSSVMASSDFDFGSIKTPGIVVFTSSIESLHKMLERLPNDSAIIVITHDRGTSGFRYIRNGLILTDVYSFMGDFTEHMSNFSCDSSFDSCSIMVDYFRGKHNCTFNETDSSLQCPDVEEARAQFYKLTSSRKIHTFNSVYDLVDGIANNLMTLNCSNYDKCVDLTSIKNYSTFLRVANGVLIEKPSFNNSLTIINGGQIENVETLSTTGSFDSSPELKSWLSNVSITFPSSTCLGYCPTCHVTPCGSTSGKMVFDGDYHYIPGDILLVGMLPFSLTWNKMSDPVCEGMNYDKNSDILSEAFIFAIDTFHSRYSDQLPNVSFGALIFDTCSDRNRASQIELNFESCQYDFEKIGNNWPPSPQITPVYIALGEDTVGDNMPFDSKLKLSVNNDGTIYTDNVVLYDTSGFNIEPVVNLLHAMDWSDVGVVTSSSLIGFDLDKIHTMSQSKNICISYHVQVSTDNVDVKNAINVIKTSMANVVLMFVNAGDANTFFRALASQTVVKTWIIIETRKISLDLAAFPIPLGTIVLQRDGKENMEFNGYLQSINADINDVNKMNTTNKWLQTFQESQNVCPTCRITEVLSNKSTLMQASDMIRAIDISIHAIQKAHQGLCGNTSRGLCQAFWTHGSAEVASKINDVWFAYQQEDIRLWPRGQQLENYVISNKQANGLIEIGRWTDQKLIFQKDKLISYNSLNEALTRPRNSLCDSSCFTSGSCLNYNNTSGNQTVFNPISLDEEMGFKSSSAVFERELWAIITVVIAGSGCLITIFLMIYIMCKVCAGSLVRRYLALGLMLLVAMVFLFLSVLPFVFTPSEAVCGMRFFAHGFSYAFCFAIILTKMTTLRDYQYIGLGGEISRINQLLSVFFITTVQIAIGVQWWVIRSPVVFTQTRLESVDNSTSLIERTYYACDFVREDFIAYHSFVIVLIVICCLYSISVRKDGKNMKEARLLLICSWFCLALWIALIVTLLVLKRDFIEPICAIGILANALSMMVIIYLPKLSAISRLKYEVSEQNGLKQNGYKVDPDFQFERPYSLPGTMHSSITDKTLSYPRSLAAFDTSMSY